MPHKAQLLLQLAQAAAKVERHQGALPSVAVNVWDTITGHNNVAVASTTTSAAAGQHNNKQQGPSSAANKAAGSASTSTNNNRGLGGFLPHLPPPHHVQQQQQASAAAASQAQLLAQQAAAFHHHWGIAHPPHPGAFTGNFGADTAVLYDNAWGMPGMMPGPLLHAGFPGLPRPAAVAGITPSRSNGNFNNSSSQRPSSSSGLQQQQPLGGGVRKSRFNNSISLNKQIMNTHSTRDLHAIVRSKGSMFDFFNISSAIARVPKLVGASGGVQVCVDGWLFHA